jgi:hypothetical protein
MSLATAANSMTGLPARLLALSAFVIGIVSLAKLVDSWLLPKEKHRIKERAIAVWFAFGGADPVSVIQTPLRFLAKVFDVMYGLRIVSWRAFCRSAIVSLMLLIAALGVTGSSIAIPGRNLDKTFEAIDEVLASDTVKKEWDKTENEEGKKLILRWVDKIKAYHTSKNTALYNVSFFSLFLFLNSLMGFGSVVIARLTLRDMIQAKTLTTLLSLAIANSMVFLIVYSIFLTTICAAAMPLTWVVVWLVYLVFVYVSWSIAFALFIPGAIVALFFSPEWIKIAAVNAALPGLLVLLLSVFAVVVFPFRRWIHRSVLEILDRATLHDKGVFGFLIILFGALAASISVMARWLA